MQPSSNKFDLRKQHSVSEALRMSQDPKYIDILESCMRKQNGGTERLPADVRAACYECTYHCAEGRLFLLQWNGVMHLLDDGHSYQWIVTHYVNQKPANQ